MIQWGRVRFNACHVPFLTLTDLASVQTPYLCWLLKHRCFPDSSVGKESSCNAGALGSIPGSRRSPGEGIGYPLQYSWASPVAQLVKKPPAVGDLGLIPGLGRSPGEGKGYPLQYSGLENSMDCMGSQRVGHNWATLNLKKTVLPWSPQQRTSRLVF